MNGERVGEWRRPAAGGQEFLYAESWRASANARPISLSLPLRPSQDPYRTGVEAFFDNLLPDNRQIRERIQRRFQTASTGAFDLLQEIGRDCVEALQLLPEDEPAPDLRRITGGRLTADGVGRLLTGSLDPTFGREDDRDEPFRSSLAGAQEKTALLWHDGAWHRPTGTTPTTHILKLPIGVSPQGIDLSTSVENEWLCAQIVREYDIPVATCRMKTFGERKTLVVERFDRRLADDGRWWLRLPQEDFCQATATPPGLKHENGGGDAILTRTKVALIPVFGGEISPKSFANSPPADRNRCRGRRGLEGAFARIRATSATGISIPCWQSKIDNLVPSPATSSTHTVDPSGGADIRLARRFTINR